MKKAILGLLTVGAAASALAQGTVTFENLFSTGSPGAVTVGGSTTYATAGNYTVALLWAAGTSQVAQGSLQVLATYTATTTGFFLDGTTITTPSGTAPGASAIFEVQGWTGTYANYAAAVAAGAGVGQTAEFVNGTGNPTLSPPGNPANTSGWDGNLVLIPVPTPEPGTLALGGLGAAALLYFRRRK
jgi:hypothetical protein